MKIPFALKALITSPIWVPVVALSIWLAFWGFVLGYGFGYTFYTVMNAITASFTEMTDEKEKL